jgi:cytochrome c peroxidase
MESVVEKKLITLSSKRINTMKNPLTLLACFFLALCITSCETELPQASLTAYLDLPVSPYYYGEGVNNDQATLGRVLFYDRQLSINNSLSCASCHKQSLAFADNVAFSKGFGSKLTLRNSMPIQNLGGGAFIGFDSLKPMDSLNSNIPSFNNDFVFFQKSLFWDGREHLLKDMVLRPIVNHVEMGVTDLKAFEQKLSSSSYYPTLFEKAYGSGEITTQKVGEALAAFLMTISSTHTKLDQVNSGQAQLTAEELKGQDLFFNKYDCNSCHQVGTVDGYIFAGTFVNIGLDARYEDEGVALVTKRPSDAGKFKIPSLRNVTLTAPYMHDGRFNTLDEVIDHYSEGIANNPNLDQRLRSREGNPLQLSISSSEKKAIISFLHTLTDHDMIKDVRFADPFKTK